MRFLIADVHRNGAGLASRLGEHQGQHDVILVTANPGPGAWSENRVKTVPLPSNFTEIVQLAKTESVDLVINYNSVYGVGGFCEALAEAGIPSIGSNQKLSATEIHKQDFKEWLIANGFRTPKPLHRGRWEDVRAKAADFSYPIVIKPNVQAGAAVSVCDDAGALTKYLDDLVGKIPYAKFGIVFTLEEYVPIVEHLHVGYFLCGGLAFPDIAVQVPTQREGRRSLEECACVLMRHPKNARHMAEVRRFIDAMTAHSDSALATVQCGIAEDGNLYFVENNARPGTDGGGLRAFADPVVGVQCLQNRDTELLSRHVHPIEEGVMIGIALQHKADEISVDVGRLESLPGIQFFPSSITRRNGSSVSVRKGIPSVVTFEGDSADSLMAKLESSLPTIMATGDYLPINMQAIRRLVAD